VIPYASRTGGKRNLDALRVNGFRLLIVASGVQRDEGWDRYALDNGAWAYHQRGEPFDEGRFRALVEKFGRRADWCVLPDIIAGGVESLALSMTWMDWVLDRCPRALIAVQDGMEIRHIDHLIGDRVGVFVGGSTDWKLATLGMWGSLASRCWVHVGRVNSVRRIRMCAMAGAHSFDGTSASVFSVTAKKLGHAARQSVLPCFG
jgi:hypothetical protein